MPLEQYLRKIADGILAIQPVFAVPVYFSVLVGCPSLWLSLVIAILPLGVRFWSTHRFMHRTPFDVPVLIFSLGMLAGFLAAADKEVAVGVLGSTFASMLIYYGLVSNSRRGNRYWLYAALIICAITFLLGIWFFSQGSARYVSFNEWFFKLFTGIPKTPGPILQFNSLGTLLAVVVPALGAIVIFTNRRAFRTGAQILATVFLGMLILSDSGGGWIAAFCGLAFAAIWWRRWTALVLVPAAGTAAWMVAVFYHRVSWIAPTFSTSSLTGRFRLWVDTLQLVGGSHTMTGLGLGSWADLYQQYYGEVQIHIHNAYLQLYTDMGFLGMLSLVAAAVVFIRLVKRMRSSSRHHLWYGAGVGMAAAIIAGAVMAVYDVTTYVNVTGTAGYVYLSVPLLWVWAALFVVAHRRLTAEKP